jgi:hypothetical protein
LTSPIFERSRDHNRERNEKNVHFTSSDEEEEVHDPSIKKTKTIQTRTEKMVNHPFFSATLAFLTCVLTGSLINQFPSPSEKIIVGMDFDCGYVESNDSFSASSLSNVSFDAIEKMILVLATILPVFPLVGKTWNHDKMNALVSHALGQGTSFGSSEFIRHFLIHPDQTFMKKCNLSVERCEANTPRIMSLLTSSSAFAGLDPTSWQNDSSKPILCPFPTLETSLAQLVSSLHGLPDLVSCLVGASVVLFVVNMIKTKKENRNIWCKFGLVLMFIIFITCATFYRLQEWKHTTGELVLSFLYGFGVQILISIMFQIKTIKEQEETERKQQENKRDNKRTWMELKCVNRSSEL